MKKRALFAVVISLLVVGMVALFAGCSDGNIRKPPPKLSTMEDLGKEIQDANAVIAEVTVGTIPSQVSSDYWFVNQVLYSALENALEEARTMYDAGNATSVEIGIMIGKLKAAVAAVEGAKQKGTMTPGSTDFTELETLIGEAEELLESVVSSANGADVTSDRDWVLEALYTTLSSTKNTAQTMVTAGTASQPVVNLMIINLRAAVTAVTNAKLPGLLASDADYQGLHNAITEANLVKTNVVRAENGSNVPNDTDWVIPSLYDALSSAISAAEAMYNTHGGGGGTRVSKIEVMAKITELEATAGAVNTAKTKGGAAPQPADFDALEAAINDAQAVLDGVVSSDDGTDVTSDKFWVTPGLYERLADAITDAQASLATKGTSNPDTAGVVTPKKNTLETVSQEVTENKLPGIGHLPDVSAIEALLDELPETSHVVIEPEENNVPGLFLDFGKKWVKKSINDDLDNAIEAAREFVANLSAHNTQTEADAKATALQDAITAYVPADGLGLLFVEVPAGSFQRYAGTGSLTTTGYPSTITRPYRISKYEITVGQWEAVMGPQSEWANYKNASSWSGTAATNPVGRYVDAYALTNQAFPKAPGSTEEITYDRTRFPASSLSWYDAIAFSNKLSAMTGKELVYQIGSGSGNEVVEDTADAWKSLHISDIPTYRANTAPGVSDDAPGSGPTNTWDNTTERWTRDGFRIPSEWEWQWAAMGANKSGGTANNGVYMDGYKKTFAGQAASSVTANGTGGRGGWAAYAWVGMTDVDSPAADNKGGTRPVGTLLPNELGIHDMSGNVAEWCWDWIEGASTGSDKALPDGSTTETTDYRGPGALQRKLAHGGEYRNNTPNRPSVWNRTGFYRHIGINDIGIRLVQTVGKSGIEIGYDPVGTDPAKLTMTGASPILKLRPTSSIKFEVEPAAGSTYQWYLTGDLQSANTNAFTVTGTDTALTYLGTYTVRVVVTTASGRIYSNTVTFTVEL